MGSAPRRLAGQDWQKIGKGTLIAVGGSLLGYVGQEVLPLLEGTSLGVLAPAGAVLINTLLKWLTDTR